MVAFSFLKFIKDQLTALPAVETQDLSGRTIIVTGSNIGLGKEAAVHFAAMNPERLVLAVRTVEKGEEAKRYILAAHPAAKVEVWKLDLQSFESVRQFAARAQRELKRLDFLLLNAGIATDKWSVTDDGYESTLQTNVISTGLLALLLLPLVEKTAKMEAPIASSGLKPHITLTGSEVHFWTKFVEAKNEQHPIHVMNAEKRFDGRGRYNLSKLLNLFLVREIGALASKNVVVNVVNPGLCHSSLLRNAGLIQHMAITVMKMCLARTTEAGSRPLVWATLNDTAQGAYSSNCTVEEESDYSLSDEGKLAQKNSWADLVEIWQKQAPEVKNVLAV